VIHNHQTCCDILDLQILQLKSESNLGAQILEAVRSGCSMLSFIFGFGTH